MSEIETKTIGELPPLPGPLSGVELLEVERPGEASYQAPVQGLIDLALGGAVADAEAARDEAVEAASAAGSSATSAGESATAASQSASAAAASETAAATSEAAAAGSAEAAAASETAAAGSASSASGAATAAAASATAAAGSRDDAAGSASAASASATAAASSASAASASATAASGSATSAAGSATTASNDADTATQAASDAQDSADSAAASANTALIAGREFGVLVARDGGIVTGGYPATRSAWGDMTLSRFFAEAIGGGATVSVRVNDDLVHGPVAVSDGQRVTQAVSIVLAEGDTVMFDVAGDATRVWAQIDGGDA